MEWITTSGILASLLDFRNETAWDVFVTRFRPAVAGFARRLGVSEFDLDDVTQDVLLDVARAYRLGRYDRSRGSLRTWVFTIAYRRVVDFLRTRERMRNGDEASAIPDERRGRDVWLEEWQAFILREALARVRTQVKPKTWRAFEMLVVEDLDPDEVARRLDMSRNAVYIAKFRVMKRLADIMREEE